jgi:peptidoglycan/LPS O-acetylase OafA/YrhL
VSTTLEQRFPALHALTLFLAATAITLPMSYLTYRFIEVPGIALGKRWVNRINQTSPVPVLQADPELPRASG